MNSGFEDDEAYNVYSEAWRKGSNIGSNIYRPTKNADKDMYGGEDLDELRKTNRFLRQGASMCNVLETFGIFSLNLNLCPQNPCCSQICTLSAIQSFRRLCKQFSESSPCLPEQQGGCITVVELSENILQNLGNDLMADSVCHICNSIINVAHHFDLQS